MIATSGLFVLNERRVAATALLTTKARTELTGGRYAAAAGYASAASARLRAAPRNVVLVPGRNTFAIGTSDGQVYLLSADPSSGASARIPWLPMSRTGPSHVRLPTTADQGNGFAHATPDGSRHRTEDADLVPALARVAALCDDGEVSSSGACSCDAKLEP